jgi:hypothetical protein
MKLANVARGTSKSVIIVAFVHASGRVTGKPEVMAGHKSVIGQMKSR